MITDIKASPAGPPISLRVASDKFPQSIAGIVWRYNADKSRDGKAGIFGTDAPSFTLGVPASVIDRYYLIEGAVLHQNDDPPTPFLVSVSLSQGAEVLFDGCPANGGSGTIGNADVPFRFTFRLVAGGGTS
jgi:hypothetical protein